MLWAAEVSGGALLSGVVIGSACLIALIPVASLLPCLS